MERYYDFVLGKVSCLTCVSKNHRRPRVTIEWAYGLSLLSLAAGKYRHCTCRHTKILYARVFAYCVSTGFVACNAMMCPSPTQLFSFIYTYICIYIYIYVYLSNVYIYVYLYIYIYIYIDIDVYMRTCVYVYIDMYLYMTRDRIWMFFGVSVGRPRP